MVCKFITLAHFVRLELKVDHLNLDVNPSLKDCQWVLRDAEGTF